MTDADEAGRRALLRTERRIAMVIATVISAALFLTMVGWQDAPSRALAFGLLPQTFAVTFFGTLMPSLILYRRIGRGDIVPAGPVPPVGHHVLRILALALVAVVVLGGAAWALVLALAPVSVPPLPGLIGNALYGGLVGGLVTPLALRAVLGMPVMPFRAATSLAVAR